MIEPSAEAFEFFIHGTVTVFLVILANEILFSIYKRTRQETIENPQGVYTLATLDECFAEWSAGSDYKRFGDFCFNKRANGWKIV